MLIGPVVAFFYLFSFILIASAVMVVAARNPVHSVLFLILAFFNAAALFLLTGAEFLAMILLVVYVGAVAVLFLFVVMMLDVDFAELKRGALQYAPIGAIVGLIVLIELVVVFTSNTIIINAAAPAKTASEVTITNTKALGMVLYTDYLLYFQLAGLVLLVSMIGAIILTLSHRPNVKRQSIAQQVARTPETAIEIKKVNSNKGI